MSLSLAVAVAANGACRASTTAGHPHGSPTNRPSRASLGLGFAALLLIPVIYLRFQQTASPPELASWEALDNVSAGSGLAAKWLHGPILASSKTLNGSGSSCGA
ncbi:hypothetical protein F5884DRAFT_743906 [Xylogone sp. PMI_703]|nr:hypothetical protein F5884DRAFT_743906 [Xylogone sp. PMI_703]